MTEIKLSLKVRDNNVRPIFTYYTTAMTLNILFDSGAEISVWTASVDALKIAFPQAKKLKLKTFISGFGKGDFSADVWNLGNFVIKDDLGRKITVENFCVAVNEDERFTFHLIISMAIFSKCIVTLDYHSKDKYMIIKSNGNIKYNPVAVKIGNTYINKRDSVLMQNMHRYECVDYIIGKGKTIEGYVLLDRQSNQTFRRSVKDIKQYIRDTGDTVDNMILTSDNRLIFKKK